MSPAAVVPSSHSRCGRWVSWHLSPTSPVNVPSTCALDLESLPSFRTASGSWIQRQCLRGRFGVVRRPPARRSCAAGGRPTRVAGL